MPGGAPHLGGEQNACSSNLHLVVLLMLQHRLFHVRTGQRVELCCQTALPLPPAPGSKQCEIGSNQKLEPNQLQSVAEAVGRVQGASLPLLILLGLEVVHQQEWVGGGKLGGRCVDGLSLGKGMGSAAMALPISYSTPLTQFHCTGRNEPAPSI